METNKFKSSLQSWLKDNITLQNKKALLVNIEDSNIYSILNYHICKSTQIPIHAVIINTDKQIAKKFCIKNNIPYSIFQSSINLNEEVINVNHPGSNRIIYTSDYNKIYELEKTAFISYITDTTNSLFVGNLTRSDYYFVRNFPKVNCYDLLPFVNFSESELQEVIKLLNINELEILENTPSANLDLEWIFNLNRRENNLIEKDASPTIYSKWYSYTASQKILIAKVYQEEKLTRHKKCNGIIFNV